MNVLSIDFDIIMAPDIPLYNNMVGPSPDGSRTVEKLSENYPLLAGSRADLKHYQKIFNYLYTIISTLNIEDIRVSYSHEDIKNVLNDLENVQIYSIDHHHDLGYDGPDGNSNNDKICTCANWGKYFLNNGTISHFTWFNNSNSGDIPGMNDDERITIQDFQQVDTSSLPKMDKLFLCLSPEWVPPMYHPLFFTLVDIINHHKNCYLDIN